MKILIAQELHLNSALNFRGLDNKCTVYPSSASLPVNRHPRTSNASESGSGLMQQKKVVAMHTSYVSSCCFTQSDHQVSFLTKLKPFAMSHNLHILPLNIWSNAIKSYIKSFDCSGYRASFVRLRLFLIFLSPTFGRRAVWARGYVGPEQFGR